MRATVSGCFKLILNAGTRAALVCPLLLLLPMLIPLSWLIVIASSREESRGNVEEEWVEVEEEEGVRVVSGAAALFLDM